LNDAVAYARRAEDGGKLSGQLLAVADLGADELLALPLVRRFVRRAVFSRCERPRRILSHATRPTVAERILRIGMGLA
jgi:hypothetical protein